MDRFKLDPNELEKKLTTPKFFKLEDVKNEVRKVAFDMVTFRNNPEVLWKIVSGEDGDYIVANYEDNILVSESSEDKDCVKESWKVYNDRMQKTATIYYKDTAIKHLSLDSIEDPEDFKYRIPKLLSKNANLVNKMLDSLDKNLKNQVLTLYPELKK